MTLFALGTILWSCDSLIYDNLTDCPQGVYVKFYSMTPCSVDSTFIGSVSSLTVFAFDEDEKLVTWLTANNVTIDRDYEVLVPVSDGYYSFIAWAGIDENFITSSFKQGETTKKDLMLTLRSTGNTAPDLRNTRLWQGESAPVFLPDPAEYGSVYKQASINMTELTNRVKVIVEFDNSITRITPQDLSVVVASANGELNINGSMPVGSPQLIYPLLNTQYDGNKSVSWDFALLDLQTGYKNNLLITYVAEGKQLFNGDLIASILLNTIGDGINLKCEHDFTIKFVVKDYCATCLTHFSCVVYVNDWIVHSYSTEL